MVFCWESMIVIIVHFVFQRKPWQSYSWITWISLVDISRLLMYRWVLETGVTCGTTRNLPLKYTTSLDTVLGLFLCLQVQAHCAGHTGCLSWVEGSNGLHTWVEGSNGLHTWVEGSNGLHTWVKGTNGLHTWVEGSNGLHTRGLKAAMG